MPSSSHLWGRHSTVVHVAAATPSRMGPLLRRFTWDHRRLVARAAGNATQLHYFPAVLPANVASGLTGLLSRARQPPRSGEERRQTRYRSCLHGRRTIARGVAATDEPSRAEQLPPSCRCAFTRGGCCLRLERRHDVAQSCAGPSAPVGPQ